MSSKNSNYLHITLPSKIRKELKESKVDHSLSEQSNKIMHTIETKNNKARKVKLTKALLSPQPLSPKPMKSKTIHNANEHSPQSHSSSFNANASMTAVKPKCQSIIVNKLLLSSKAEPSVTTKLPPEAKVKSLSESNSLDMKKTHINESNRKKKGFPNPCIGSKQSLVNFSQMSTNNKITHNVKRRSEKDKINEKKSSCITPQKRAVNPVMKKLTFQPKNIKSSQATNTITTTHSNDKRDQALINKQSSNICENASKKRTALPVSTLNYDRTRSCNIKKQFKLIPQHKRNHSKDITINSLHKFHVKPISSFFKHRPKTEQNSFESPKLTSKTNNAMNDTTISIKSPLYTENYLLTSPNTTSVTLHKRIGKIFSLTKAGSSLGEEKINQDNYFITQHFLNKTDDYLLGVCDGHGENGHLASGFIVNTLPETLLEVFEYENCIKETHSKIKESFCRLNNELIEHNDIDTKFSGTTCVATIISKDIITCANLGDSRAVLGRYDKGAWTASDLSRDHKASEKDETERIMRKGGRIASYIDENTMKTIGPPRVWLKEANIPGLAMTRSFGDQIAHCIGVISEPEIKEFSLNGTEAFIVIASDGVWEFIDSGECVYLIKDYYLKGDVYGACHSIVDEAFNRWQKRENFVDDITVVVAFFE